MLAYLYNFLLAPMKASEVIDTLQGAISRTKEMGITQIEIDNLEAFAKELASAVGQSPDDVEAGEAALESYKAHLSGWVAERQHSFDRNLEMLRATVLTGQSALNSALLINGGAAAALLAFVGSIWSSAGSKAALPLVADALLHFVYGVLSAAVASGFTYLSQAGYGNEFGKASMWIGRSGHIVAVFGVLISYVLFGRAAWIAFRAVLGANKHGRLG